jgi:ATP-dependent Clp protease protease subunit
MNPRALVEQWMAYGGAQGQLYPGVIERGSATERMIEVDVRAKLIEQRIIFLGDVIYPAVANIIISQMLFLWHQRRDADIYLYVNSPGGSIEAGLAVYDTMQFIKCDVNTICVGLAASMAAVLLAAGAKGKRQVLPNSKLMIHQPWISELSGTATDVMIEARELEQTKTRLNSLLAKHAGRSLEEMEKATDRNKWLTAEEAVEFGLADEVVLAPKSETPKPPPAT